MTSLNSETVRAALVDLAERLGDIATVQRSVLGGWTLLVRVGEDRRMLIVGPEEWSISASRVPQMLHVIDDGLIQGWDDVLDAMSAIAKQAKDLVDSDS